MKSILSMVGDGEGNISMMRVITFLTALSVLLPKIVLTFKTGIAPVWDSSDMELLGVVLGAKLIQNQQEKTTTPPPA